MSALHSFCANALAGLRRYAVVRIHLHDIFSDLAVLSISLLYTISGLARWWRSATSARWLSKLSFSSLLCTGFRRRRSCHYLDFDVGNYFTVLLLVWSRVRKKFLCPSSPSPSLPSFPPSHQQVPLAPKIPPAQLGKARNEWRSGRSRKNEE